MPYVRRVKLMDDRWRTVSLSAEVSQNPVTPGWMRDLFIGVFITFFLCTFCYWMIVLTKLFDFLCTFEWLF